MFLLIPYRVDVPLYRYPIANYVIIAAIAVCFGVEMANLDSPESIEPFVLNGWQPLGLIGHIFLHGGIMHLVGNLLFLWVFGNAVCEKLGNIAYPFVFLGLGVLAAAAHNLMSDAPVIGASGAINGVVGMFLVWFPINEISCFYLIWFIIRVWYGWFDLSSYWMILLWLLFDIAGAALGGDNVAYWAHLGGFAAGMVLAAFLTKLEWVMIYDGERTLLDVFHLRKSTAQRAQEYARAHPPKNAVLATAGYAPPAVVEAPPKPIPLVEHEPLILPSEARKKQEAMPPIELPAAPPVREKVSDAFSAPAPPSAPKFIRFQCRCGKSLKAPPEKAGKRAQCPACKEIVQVPTE